ncbi:hypothetical protein Tco_0031562 [Tanacetum coccineum]
MAKKQARDKQPKEPKTDRAFWSQEEEKILAKYFIEISEDPKNESDQARDTFWYKILTIYNQQADELGFKTRNKNMLTGKWTPMNHDVQKFNANYNQTELLSGENEENLYTRVLSLFRDQNNVEFRHREAWLFLKDKYKWTNPESTKARRTRGRVTGKDELGMFGDDAIPRPSGAPRKSKSQRSSASSSSTPGSSKNRVTEYFQEQIQLDCEAKKESLDRELAARLTVVELQKRNEDLKILTFDTTGMNPDDAAKIEALKEKTRDGIEKEQWLEMLSMLDTVMLSSSIDRWVCDLNGEGDFRVKDVRSSLDELFLPSMDVATRWVKFVPKKINVFAWRARLDRLPTRLNLIKRAFSGRSVFGGIFLGEIVLLLQIGTRGSTL